MKELVPVDPTISRRPGLTQRPRQSSYNTRFGITESGEERFRQFKNRTLDTIDRILGAKILANQQLEREYLHFLGRPCPTTKTPDLLTTSPLKISALLAGLGGADFAQSAIFRSLRQEDSPVEYCHCLDALFHLPLPQADLQSLYDGFANDLRVSSIGIRIASYGGHYGFFPTGVRVLDERVVDADLQWLVSYPQVLAEFEKALAQSPDLTKQREMLDSLRFSLENILKQLLGNRKRLEKNKDAVLKWMDDQGTSVETRQMMNQLFHFYCNYQNEHVKHEGSWKPAEVDFILYLTATFIHLLAELNS